MVHGNSNLNNSANTIINEVTGTGRSQINGVQEILGKSANYILANPNGITVIGGEFINVNSATLTTGKVGLNSLGQLEKFLIEKGDIEIDGVDIDVSNLDHFDIIARSVKLNTAIYARKEKGIADSKNTSLQVVAGSGEYDVKNQKLTKGKAGSSVPSFAIDSSKLGGLYAGKIKLISSEDGVGVNLPDIQATTGSVEITADGKIVHKNISSPRKTKIKSQNDKIVIAKDRAVASGGDIEYQGKKGVEIQDSAKIVSQGSISLQSSDGKVLNKGGIVAGGKKGVSVTSKGLQNNASISTLPGTLGGITINSSDTIVNNGLIQTDLNFATIFANGFKNSGKVESKQASYQGDRFENFARAQMHSHDDTKIALTEGFSNAGRIESQKIAIASIYGSVNNSGQIVTYGDTTIASRLGFENSGRIMSISSPLQVVVGEGGVSNSGQMVANSINISSKSDIENSELLRAGLIDIKSFAGSMQNSGQILSSGTSDIKVANDFRNENGEVISSDAFKLDAGGSFFNAADSSIISTSSDVVLRSGGDATNTGHIEAGRSSFISSGGRLVNDSQLLAGADMTLTVLRGIVNNVAGLIKSKEKQSLTSGSSFTNYGKIHTDNSLVLSVNNDVENTGTLEAAIDILSSGSFGGALRNRGNMLAGKSLNISSVEEIINTRNAHIEANESVKLKANLDIDNAGLILSLEDAVSLVSVASINNEKDGYVDAQLALTIKAAEGVTNSGIFAAGDNLQMDAGKSIVNSVTGQIGATNNVTLRSIDSGIYNEGLVSAERAISIISGDDVINRVGAEIVASTDLEIKSATDIINSGLVKSGSALDVEADRDIDNQASGRLKSEADLVLKSANASINNDGLIEAIENIALAAKTSTENNGIILGKKDIKVDAISITNKGLIKSDKITSLSAENNIENIDSGKIDAGGELELESKKAYVKNSNSDPTTFDDSGIIARVGVVIKSVLGFENDHAHLETAKGLEILTTGSFLNDSGNIIVGEVADFRVDGDVRNIGGGAVQSVRGLAIRGKDNKEARSLENSGSITSGIAGDGDKIPTILGKITILTKHALANDGIVQAIDDVNLESTAGEVRNSNTILSKSGKVEITSKGKIDNTGAIESSKELLATSKNSAIDNAGTMQSTGSTVDLGAKEKIDHKSGVIRARGDIELVSYTDKILVNGDVNSSTGSIAVNADKDITTTKQIRALQNVTISSKSGKFENITGNVIAGETLDISATSIKNESDNAETNGHLHGKLASITAKSGNILNKGTIHSDGAGKVIASGGITNTATIALGDKSFIDAGSEAINNSDLIISSGEINIAAEEEIINSGNIEVLDLVISSKKLVENSAGGQIKATNGVVINQTPTITNAGLIEFDTMNAVLGINGVANSGTLKGRALDLTARRFDNTGRTELTGGVNLKVDTLNSNTLIAGGKSDITINGNYTNTGRLHVPDADLSITANSITNSAGAVLKAKSFTGIARPGGSFTNNGMIFGKNGLTITAPTITNNTGTSHLISGGAVALTATGGTVTNRGGVYGAGGVTIGASTITNNGTVRSPANVKITGSTTNYGTLAGQNKLEVIGNLTNTNSMISNANLSVSGGGSINNGGYMTSRGSMTLKNTNLHNYGKIEAVGALRTNQAGSITNDSSIYAGTLNLTAGSSITNKGDLIARDNMTLVATTGDVVNKKQISLTGGGLLSISAGRNIRNDREYNIVRVNRENPVGFSPMAFPDIHEVLAEGWYTGKTAVERLTRRVAYSDIYTPPAPGELEIVPTISSNASMRLSAGETISNAAGNISARSTISLTGKNLKNEDILVQRNIFLMPKTWYRTGYIDEVWSTRKLKYIDKHKTKNSHWVDDPHVWSEELFTLGRIPSLIQAGGAISGSLAGAVMLGSPSSGPTKAGIESPGGGGVSRSGTYTPNAAAPATAASAGVAYNKNKHAPALRAPAIAAPAPTAFVNPVVVSRPSNAKLSADRARNLVASGARGASKLGKISMDDSALSRLAGALADTYSPPPIAAAPEISWSFDDPEIAAVINDDWTKSKSPGNYYINETSEVFADMSTYFSTDNFIKRIEGFEPKKSKVAAPKTNRLHFGDSMKQMDFVRRQMVELTGLGSLDDSTGYTEQIKQLYETGIKHGKEMKLTAGVALSEAQVDALTDDIVWAEEIELRGTKVIVPRLYVAKSKRGKRASGLLAKTIDIDAGSIVNNGSSIVGDVVALRARDGDIVIPAMAIFMQHRT